MSKNQLVIINGFPRSGKDKFVEFAREELTATGLYSQSISSIAPVWAMIEGLGIDLSQKTPAQRNLAADIKNALNRYNRYADKMTMMHVANAASNYVFLHVREPESIAFITRTMGKDWQVTSLLLSRDETRQDVYENAADANVEDYIYTCKITNNGSLEDLKLLAIDFVKKFVL